MRGVEIRLRQRQVRLYHLQRRVPQRHLELERVAAVAQEIHGERVAEPVRVSIPHAGLVPQPNGSVWARTLASCAARSPKARSRL